MEQHAAWTELVLDIILWPLRCCLMNEASNDGRNLLITRSLIGLQRPVPRTTDTTPLLNSPKGQYHGLGQKGFEGDQTQSYHCFPADEDTMVVAQVPIEYFEASRQWEDDATDSTDDQGTETDPFEYDNSPEYQNILGHRVTAVFTTNSNTLSTSAGDEGLTQDLLTIRRMFEEGLKRLQRDTEELAESRRRRSRSL